ncbi:phosphatidylglycerol lysyltransferase domain-containing protein [Romboutsia sedimentorum]|uniref:Phosphatidylglycerol lysyltransferase domain-containing protein n=1 Tax=Romboutsia sedimentorum TaxID=1368474 RepID=A0ABT7E796_9FIRM|nr:phosphatidylglycerol lysyltransferase domain-containing protein [Romboutsia sedimentorum]MDK2562803.1 phosphatidylglycerol lysyltransferase domain-containing protein [Romboutsia sedimentorum]MDK2585714.1 phosphatidylglycerol lysyltransferase domain-containing protein [Romboutsia sedimentorum]
MIFKEININSKEELDPYFDMIDYEACEYCFSTLYMWQHVYKTGYYIGEDFAVIVGEYEGDSFSILPLATKDKLPKVIEFVLKYFEKENKKIYFRGITEEVVEFLKNNYLNRFEYTQERDLFDYIYDGESLRSLQGKKNQKKRNHINYFLKEYDGRYEYKLLENDDFKECLDLMKEWTSNKEENDEFDEGMDDELSGIKKIFNDYDILKNKVKVAGIYVDNKLEAFTIGELLNENMALVHIEKANPNIRGLYPYINQQFIVNEFENVDFVNREEDLGIEGLRKAKLSYHPCRFVEKYTVREAKNEN